MLSVRIMAAMNVLGRFLTRTATVKLPKLARSDMPGTVEGSDNANVAMFKMCFYINKVEEVPS